MCTYQYKYKLPYGIETIDCPIPGLFDQWKEILPSLVERGESNIPDTQELIYDGKLCIFHSERTKWKADVGVMRQFHFLLQILTFLEQSCPEGEHLEINLAEISLYDPEEEEVHVIEAYQFPHIRLYLTHCSFHIPLTFENCSGLLFDFSESTFYKEVRFFDGNYQQVNFDACTFRDNIAIEYTEFHGFVDMAYCQLYNGLNMTSAVFHQQFIFARSHVLPSETGGLVSISAVFKDFVDFTACEFNLFLILSDCIFEGEVNFSNAIFRSRFFLLRPLIYKNFFIKGDNNREEVFQDLVDIDVEDDFGEGKIIFENVSFMNIHETHRQHLLQLSQKNKVIIGKGCIKYRLQSPDKTLDLSPDNQTLIVEFAQTFTNYFINSFGMSLGLEIKDRKSNQLTFFYYSDENIPQEVFREKLKRNEEEFLGLVFFDKSEFDSFHLKDTQQQDRMITKMDGIAAIGSIFLRAGIRIVRGKWKQSDTQNLLLSINFDQNPYLNFRNLHHILLKKFEQGQIVNHFLIQDKGVLNIENQHIYGGNNQFADTIIHKYGGDASVNPKEEIEKIQSTRTLSELKQKVVAGHLEEVLELLIARDITSEIQNDLLYLKKRYLDFERDKHRTTMSRDAQEIIQSKIYYAAFGLIDAIEE